MLLLLLSLLLLLQLIRIGSQLGVEEESKEARITAFLVFMRHTLVSSSTHPRCPASLVSSHPASALHVPRPVGTSH
jgi:hypothetical protein